MKRRLRREYNRDPVHRAEGLDEAGWLFLDRLAAQAATGAFLEQVSISRISDCR